MTAGHSRACLPLLAALALGGCALLGPPPPKKPPPVAHLPQHPHPPAALPTTGSAAAAARLQPDTAAPAPSAAPPPSPAQVNVIGLSEDAVRRLLGDPSGQAASGPAQTWTYDGGGCQVQIAFFYDVTRSNFFALSARQPDGGDGRDCLDRIHASHATD